MIRQQHEAMVIRLKIQPYCWEMLSRFSQISRIHVANHVVGYNNHCLNLSAAVKTNGFWKFQKLLNPHTAKSAADDFEHVYSKYEKSL